MSNQYKKLFTDLKQRMAYNLASDKEIKTKAGSIAETFRILARNNIDFDEMRPILTELATNRKYGVQQQATKILADHNEQVGN